MCFPYVPLNIYPLSPEIVFIVATDWSRSGDLSDKAVSSASIVQTCFPGVNFLGLYAAVVTLWDQNTMMRNPNFLPCPLPNRNTPEGSARERRGRESIRRVVSRREQGSTT